MTIDLTLLYKKQSELDAEIAKNHNVTYASTRTRRIIALLVELGEFANSTRAFKYWSNKPSESRERVLDEYADGMHFFLSLGIDINSPKMVYEVPSSPLNINELILKTYTLMGEFARKQDVTSYQDAFLAFLQIAEKVEANEKDIVDAYLSKLDVNYKRQENNY